MLNKDIFEQVQEEIDIHLPLDYWRKKITRAVFKEQIQQTHQASDERLSAQRKMFKKVERIHCLTNASHFPAIEISYACSQTQLAHILLHASVEKILSESPQEQAFFEAIIETVEACKALADEQRGFDTKTILILETEYKRAERFVEQLNHTVPLKRKDNTYVQVLVDTLHRSKEAHKYVRNHPQLPLSERLIFDQMYQYIHRNVANTLHALLQAEQPCAPQTREDLLRAIHRQVAYAQLAFPKASLSKIAQNSINRCCNIWSLAPLPHSSPRRSRSCFDSIRFQIFHSKDKNPHGKEDIKDLVERLHFDG